MNVLELTRTLIVSCTPEEKDFCRRYLKVFDLGEESNRKILQLFNILCRNTKLSEAELCKVLYSKPKTNSFIRVQVRLRDKLLDALVIEQNLRREGKRSERTIQSFLLRRKLNHADVLIDRKQYGIARKILEEVEETAEKFELFDETLSSLRLQLQLANSRKDFDKAHHLQLDLFYCCKRIFAVTAAQHIITTMLVNPSEDISERLQKLNDNERDAPSIHFSFFLIGINVLVAQRNGNYKAAENLLTKQLILASNYPELKDRQLIGEICLELAKSSIHLGAREKTKEYLIEADRFLDNNTLLEEREQINKQVE